MKSKLKYSIVVMSDQPLYFAGLKKLFNVSQRFYVKDHCRNPPELLLSLKVTESDLIIMDVSLLAGFAQPERLLSKIKKLCPGGLILGLGENDPHRDIIQTLKPAVSGYLCKSMEPDDIRESVLQMWKAHQLQPGAPGGRLIDTDKADILLSSRERLVIGYYYCGMTVSQISRRLNRSVKTVSTQKQSAMRKLGIKHDRDIFSLCLD